ncbi:DUF6046 domain-containing protein [Pedobacter sp.]|uniref:DUF6046 domain-containing protein n=1 Tax=Pedobacter sp. TaxID=1411316 RepID=UPI0031D3F6ED
MEFSIKELTALAHLSYIAAPYPDFGGLKKDALKRKAQSYYLHDVYNLDQRAALGKPYFMTLEVQEETIQNKNQNQNQIVSFPNEPLVSISRKKTIVETATVGENRMGTVKEYICAEDYEIDIKGVIIGAGDAYPAEEVKMLNNLFNIKGTLTIVKNPFFELFGIQRIILKTISFDEMVGKQSIQKYTIKAVSEEPFFAELENRNK